MSVGRSYSGSATVLAVVSLAGVLARTAIAQIRAAVVKNIDEKGRIAFQSSVPCMEGRLHARCISSRSCKQAAVIEYVGGDQQSDAIDPSAAITTRQPLSLSLPTF